MIVSKKVLKTTNLFLPTMVLCTAQARRTHVIYIDSQAKFEFEQFHQCEIKQTTAFKNCQFLHTNSFSSLYQCPNMFSPQSPQKFFFRFAQFAAVNFHCSSSFSKYFFRLKPQSSKSEEQRNKD